MGHRGVLINAFDLNAVNVVDSPDLSSLRDLVRGYGVGELVRHWPATTGIENRNYFLVTRVDSVEAHVESHYVLTVLERAPNAGDALVPLLDACTAAGLPVPGVLRDGDGRAVTEFGGKPAMLCPRLPGRHVYNPTERQVEALGRFIARLHLAASAAELGLPAYPRDLAWLREHADALRGHVPYRVSVLMADVRRQIESALSRQDVGRLPRGPIHGDLFRDNVLFNEWGLAGVLDFHHAAHGFLVYDLAVAANDWCTDAGGALDRERALALLRAYHGIRPIHPEELWHFPLFALYAGLAFWTSRLVVAIEQRRGRAVRTNNPDELKRIVEQHAAHFFYVDERLLS